MSENLIAKTSITINAPAGDVWKALTDPTMIKKYLFGTNVETDWKVGSPITYRGEWKGKKYEDKGKILKVEHGKLLESTYWSGMSGLEDKPENYKKVTYSLSPTIGGTKLTITQDNNPSEEAKEESEQNWSAVLESMKNLLEK